MTTATMEKTAGTMLRVVLGSCCALLIAFAEPAAAQRYRCDDCGTVMTTNRNDQKGSATAGTIVGGVGGAVAGNLIGHNTTSTVIGGVGGAVAGNVIGRRLTSKKIWSVQVRMDRGGTRSVDYDRDPKFHQGDRVRITREGQLARL